MRCRIILLLSAVTMVSACTGPNVKPPVTPSSIAAPAASWSAEDEVQAGNLKMDWWTVLADPALDALVAKALAHNADIRAAAANLAASQMLLREAKAAGRPTGGIAAGIERTRTSAAALQVESFGGPAVLASQTLADVGTSLSWEIDLAGRLSSMARAASADRARAVWSQRGAEAAVVAGVVRAWIELGVKRQQLAIVGERLAGLAEAARAVDAAVAAGGLRADQADVIATRRRALEADEAALRVAERNAARRLATLTGMAAPAGVARMAELQPGAMPLPYYVTVPDPSALLRQRPDVAMAEQDLLKASAGIGIARADLYPRISFGGSVGVTAAPGDIASAGALRFGIGPSISWGLFDMDRIRARIRAAGAQAEAAAAAWESTYLKAIEETDGALDQLAAARLAWKQAVMARQLASQMEERALVRVAAGGSSILAGIEAHDQALVQDLAERDARLAALQAWINVQIALGAGWRASGA